MFRFISFAKFILAVLSFSLLLGQYAFAEEDSRIEFSGFARVVGGYLNTDNAEFSGYTNSFSVRNDSLLGLRADGKISESLSLVAQAILRTSTQLDSEVQWLYLDYRPTNDLSFKFGRQRIPLYQYSEIIDVGFAYPWVALPREVYKSFVFDDYDGVLGSYEFSTENLFGSVDAYYGIYDGDVIFGDLKVDASVRDIMGLAANLQIHQFNFRASYHKADVEVVFDDSLVFQQTLAQLGFLKSAKVFTINDPAAYYQVSALWENLNYFTRFEFTGFESDAYLVPKTNNFYMTLGYNFNPYTVHLTYAHSNVEYDPLPNEIPSGINPQLDFLSQQFQATFRNKPINDSDSVTLGIRYELRTNIALKAEVTFFDGILSVREDNNTARIYDTVSEKTELLQIAAEWVF